MKRALAVALLGLTGCAGSLSEVQRELLLKRIRDVGDVAKAAVRERDDAEDELAIAKGRQPRGSDRATLAWIDSETGDTIAAVRSNLR